ncbi:hypothetical protein [Ammoniphilus resinae]|uniref:Uncharacterized protein n=1 Tax=Ammoniphilus resinae TaxID=861532 RepID=A0ABS4GPG2_9BACL|nr:hypothetical protein [Ammoniphilus resinae]MBP1932164.1 hypothetical protein [Ammoniphilus resinae]
MDGKMERSTFLLLETTLNMKRALCTFLREYQRFLKSLGRQKQLQGALALSFPRLLFSLQMIRQIHCQKIHLLGRDVKQSAAFRRFFDEDQRIERQISSTLREIQKYLSGDIPTPSPPWLLSHVKVKNDDYFTTSGVIKRTLG